MNTVAECYHVLGIVHHAWTPLQERIKDYIASPKPNGYQSLHTTVFGPGGRLYEIQGWQESKRRWWIEEVSLGHEL